MGRWRIAGSVTGLFGLLLATLAPPVAAADADCIKNGGKAACTAPEVRQYSVQLCDEWNGAAVDVNHRYWKKCSAWGGVGDCTVPNKLTPNNLVEKAIEFEALAHHVDSGPGCTISGSTAGWLSPGQSLSSGYCWSGSPTFSGGVETSNLMRVNTSGMGKGHGQTSCTASFAENVMARRARTAACPMGYKTRSISGSYECYRVEEEECPCCDGACRVGNPVSPASGKKTQVEVDYEGPGPFPLRIVRSYSSAGWFSVHGQRNETSSTLDGYWRLNYDRRIYSVASSAYTNAVAVRGDGIVKYFAADGREVLNKGTSREFLETLTDGSGGLLGWRYRTAGNEVEEYDAEGKLLSITSPEGLMQTLEYSDASTPASIAGIPGLLIKVTDAFNRSLDFTYDGRNRIVSVTDPEGIRYEYVYSAAATGNLVLAKVVGTAGETTQRTYHYENATFPRGLTGITDEKNNRIGTYQYDSSGRATLTQGANATNKYTLVYGVNSTTVTDPLNTARAFGYQTLGGVVKNTSMLQGSSTTAVSYDSRGFVSTRTDLNGNVTTYEYDDDGRQTSRTEAFGTTLARTTTTEWHPTLRVPLRIEEPGRETTYTYTPGGKRLTETVRDLATGETRTTTNTYNALGLLETVDGPRTDVADVTTYDYDSAGNLALITNALGHETQITHHDAGGRPLRVLDANGVETVLTYDWRGRLKTRTVAGATTSFDYDAAGLLTKATLPGGAYLSYTYDAARRLTDVEDNLGNKIHYTLDAMGNRTQEEVLDPAGVIKRVQSQVFDSLNRLDQVKNAAGTVVTDYGYDAQGNRTSQLEYSTPTTSHATTFVPDALNRIKQVTDAGNGVTLYGYNALDQLVSVTDPKDLVTTYTYNALGDLQQQVSPDTGTTQYPIYDAAGNRKRQIDARGVQADYTFDALSRLTSISYNGFAAVTYTYDSAAQPYGKGRLTGITDDSGTTILTYDARGNVTEERRTDGGSTYVTGYSYDSADRVSTITYPTGRIVTYERNNALGQVTRVTTTVGGVTTIVADSIAYMPFGGIKSYALGNGVVVTRNHDLDYRLDEIKDQGTALIQELRLFYDLRGNVDATQDLVSPGRSQTFGYDGLSRLTQAAGLYGTRGYSYDAVGNRLTEVVTPPSGSAVTDTYTYPSSSHRLSSIAGGNPASFTYDEVGNVIWKNDSEYWYNFAGRLEGFNSSLDSLYNAAGQRTSSGKGSFFYHYDREGHLLVETDWVPAVLREYVWLGDLPLSLEGVANEPAVVVDNGDPGFSATGNWSGSTAASGYYGADYAVRAAGPIGGTQVLDNGASGTSKSGTWQNRTSPSGYYGSNFERSSQAAAQYSWSLPLSTAGEYKVYVRYPSDPTFRSKANYAVSFAGGLQTYEIDQRSGGGAWRLLGTHSFATSAQVTLTVGSGSTGTYLAADAVKIVPVGTEVARWSVPDQRTYDVYARWPASIMHSAGAVFRIQHAGGTTEVVYNQQFWGDFWAYLGTFEFNDPATQSVMLLADENAAVAADAVMFQPAYGTSPTLKAYYHLDHLGTPQKLTDSSQDVIWDASYEPFGKVNLLTEGITQPLRFPGQYFDLETGLHQNWHRDYDPSIGRYLQSDPIGLRGGLSTYTYVNQNPLRFLDRAGLVKWEGSQTGGEFFTAGLFYFNLRSQCIDGRRGWAKILAVGPGLGFGVEITGTSEAATFEDGLAAPDPNVFDGKFLYAGAGIAIPRSAEQSLGIRLAGGGNPANGFAGSAIQLGGARSIGVGLVWGFDFSVGALVGSSTVLDAGVEDCFYCEVE
jgi:RHS repeat-associated protein